jgi:hypothetical protein
MESSPKHEQSMISQRHMCVRCGGYLVREEFVDRGGTCEPPSNVACRCMNCGNVVDELIIQHQKSPPRPIRGGSHSPER